MLISMINHITNIAVRDCRLGKCKEKVFQEQMYKHRNLTAHTESNVQVYPWNSVLGLTNENVRLFNRLETDKVRSSMKDDRS